MKTEKIKELIDKYNTMLASPAEHREIELLIESGAIDLEDLQDIHRMEDQLMDMKTPEPTMNLDDRFYAMLREGKRVAPKSSWQEFFSWPALAPRLGFASIALIVGFSAGMFFRMPEQENTKLTKLGEEVRDMKELMMLTMLEKESATERLKAVSLTSEMDDVSHKVSNALLQTLNSDENESVRLAALDALRPYSRKSEIRTALIKSISQQDSPLVQIALAELMAQLQEKKSVKELERIIHDNRTPSDVRKQIEQTIQVLI